VNRAELLADLVRIKTPHPHGDELALCHFVAPLLAARGADEVRVVETGRAMGGPGGYVYARWGRPDLVFNAHVDTVPANTGWSRDPWTPAIENGRLYGLGSADTKGAIVSILAALDMAPAKDVAVLFSGDEERGTAAMKAFLRSPDRRGVTHAIVCEPTARQAGVRHRGVLSQKATVRGAGGHSSRADRMPAPVVTMAKLAVALDAIGRTHRTKGPADMPGLCLNVAALEGGVAFNVVPDAASLLWSIRPAPGFDRAAWDVELGTAVASVDPSITVADQMDHIPFACSDVAGLGAMLPGVPQVGLDFWTEAALHEAAGIAAVVIGPGDIAQAHAPDESVALDDLDWAAEVFAAALRSR
jgi:acetylornithine deacetylase